MVVQSFFVTLLLIQLIYWNCFNGSSSGIEDMGKICNVETPLSNAHFSFGEYKMIVFVNSLLLMM